MANNLAGRMQQLGLSIKAQQAFTPLLDKNARKSHLMSLRDLSPSLVSSCLIEQNDIKTLSQCLENELASVDTVSLYQMFQAVGVKAS